MNPIIKWRQENPEISWDSMSRMTGISKGALLLLRHMGKESVGDIRLRTILRLKNTIGIDLIEYANSKNT
jgi:hypothetical protein